MSAEKMHNRLGYFVTCISEFAGSKGIAHVDAFDYLNRFRGMEFLVKCYEAEHTVSLDDAVADLTTVCRRHGGVSKKIFEYLVDVAVEELAAHLIKTEKLSETDALARVYHSKFYQRLSNRKSGLFGESRASLINLFEKSESCAA